MKRIFAFLLVVVLMLSLSVAAFAQTVSPEGSTAKGSIVIHNAAKGIDYKVYKVFDASIAVDSNGNPTGPISYTLPEGVSAMPAALADYFQVDTAGNVTVKAAGLKEGSTTELSDAAIAALKSWAESQTPLLTATSDGSKLTFDKLPYGYYVVTTNQGSANISVDSANKVANIYDKNSTPPVDGPVKEADGTNFYIGDTITYTVSFGTANFNGTGSDAKRILSYTIQDTLPAGLTNVTVTSLTIGGENYTVDGAVPQFDANKTITIPWVSGTSPNYTSLYANGAEIVITYTAVLSDAATIDSTGNTNTVTITFEDENGTSEPYTDDWTVYTFAIAIKKVDEDGNNLAGAVFTLPFYVKETPDANDGAYIYGGTEAGTGLVNELTTPADGLIIIKGLKSGTAVSITEKAAPEGYNKLSDPISVTPAQTGHNTTTVYFDENGTVITEQTNAFVDLEISSLAATPVLVINHAGTELPSTGGIGTTIFYVLGGILAVGAAVVLIARKRVSE